MRRWISAAVVAATILTVAPTRASAGLLPVQVSVTPEGGMTRFTYAIVLPTDAVLRPGDYFTIYDFDGFVPGSNVANGSPYSADWAFSSSNSGPVPAGLSPNDNPNIPNLTWAYTGPTIDIFASIGLGNFWALSTYSDTTESWFTASTGTSVGGNDSNITPTVVPVPTGPPPAVPEPATLLLVGIGLPLAAALRRRNSARTL